MSSKILIGALVWLIVCIVSCWETNRDIEKIKEADRPSKIRSAPVFGLSIVAAVLLFYIITGG